MTRCGFPIPGADILTYITAEHPGSHRLMKLIRYLLFELDSEIGDAAAAIHLIRLMNRIRRAGIDAACTAPAVIRHRRIVDKGNIYKNLSDQKPGAHLAVQQVAVFSDPAQTTSLCPDFIHNGCRVNQDTAATVHD